MPHGLERRYATPSSHFITCSCYRRLPLLNDDLIKEMFPIILEELRQQYRFCVYGYVLMPEHFHLLMTKPEIGNPSTVLQILKQRVARYGLKILPPTLSQKTRKNGAPTVAVNNEKKRSFWQTRFYDFNVCTEKKRIEKLRYIHRNPVKRGLVAKPEDWRWSSFRHYATGEVGTVEIESQWTARRREKLGVRLTVNMVPTRED